LSQILPRAGYQGRVCLVTALRPDSVVKDDVIPHLLRTAPQPMFVTLDWRHFWERMAGCLR
jgi:hypothetical protein